jgi:hypothetical protein
MSARAARAEASFHAREPPRHLQVQISRRIGHDQFVEIY